MNDFDNWWAASRLDDLTAVNVEAAKDIARQAFEAGRSPALPLRELVKLDIKRLVDRFLGWKLPENFRPDAGISFKPTFNDHLPTPMRHEPMGTNLFDAIQAEAMLRYVLAEYLEHPSIRGEKSVASFMDKGIMAELEEHAKATLGEDAYIRIYPSDARAILSALSAAGVPSEHAEFRLYCADGDDEYVAAEAYGIRNDAWAEICRYAAQYAQDGPVRIEEIIRIPNDP